MTSKTVNGDVFLGLAWMRIPQNFEGGAGDAPVLTLRRWVTFGSCEVSTNSPPCWARRPT